MFSRGIRGAITIDEDREDLLEEATVELMENIIKSNEIELSDISHIIFTLTKDIKCGFPAKFFRIKFNADSVPMMCMNELDVETGLKKCLRVLVVVNTQKNQKEIKHVYLKNAKNLRPDIAQQDK